MAAFFLATESFDTPPPLPFPLHSPFILESALFYKRSPSVIMASWTPVLVCLTRARILHIFELDTVRIISFNFHIILTDPIDYTIVICTITSL